MKDQQIRQILLETISASPDPAQVELAKQSLAALDKTAAKPHQQKSPTEDSSVSDRYFRAAEAKYTAHLAEEAQHKEAIEVLLKSGHQLFAAASAEVRRQNPTTQAGDLDCLVCPLIASWMNSPEQAPDEIREVIGYLKTAKRHLLSVGIDWPVGGLDSPFGDTPWGSDEHGWYSAPQEETQENNL